MRRAMAIGGAMLFVTSIALLCVSIAAPGAAAIGAFRSLPKLGVELPEYASYSAGDPAVAGRIAAGFVLEDLFRVTTWTSTVLAVMAGVAWLGVMASGTALRAWAARLALGALVVAIGAAALSHFEEPELSDSLANYRELARKGDRAGADEAKRRFDGWHHRAERERQVQIAAALAALAMAAWALASPRARAETTP